MLALAERKYEDTEPDELIKQARSMALENLAQNIKVKVKGELKVTSIQNDKNNHITFSENIQSNLSTHADITIFNIDQDGLWLDQEKCIVWIRIKVNQSLVDQLFMISQAETNYDIANQSDLSLKERLRKIEESIDLIQSVDFSIVPTKGQMSIYLKKYRKLQSNLKSQEEGRKMVYVVHAPTNISRTMINDLLVSPLMNMHQWISARYDNDMDCHTIGDCLEMARSNRAIYLVYVMINTNVMNLDMGFHKGKISIGLSLYDVPTGQLKFHQDTSNMITSLTHDETSINWRNVIESFVQSNEVQAFIEALPK